MGAVPYKVDYFQPFVDVLQRLYAILNPTV